MPHDERQLHRLLAERFGTSGGAVTTGIGDDLAVLKVGGAVVLTGSDMLLDGVHFRTEQHSLEEIGYKAAASVLSDCAAMAAEPVAVTLSIAARKPMNIAEIERIVGGAARVCESFDCDLVGGDTTAWDHPLAVDAAIVATCSVDRGPVLRSGARVGDALYVSGPLGGSLSGKHMKFVPRIREAQLMVRLLVDRLHAMMDISDGLAIDADRMGEASNLGMELDADAVDAATSDAARALARDDQRSPRDHALGDGEDFELLVAAALGVEEAAQFHLLPVGKVVDERGLFMRFSNGTRARLEPRGFQHF